MTDTAGAKLWQALEAERPLQIVGTVNAYAALLAGRAGFRAIYLSGAGVANYSYGLPDLGMTTLDNVLEGRTAIIIAHRLATAMRADRIAIIDGGRLVELGDHQQLVRQQGRYADMFRTYAGEGAA